MNRYGTLFAGINRSQTEIALREERTMKSFKHLTETRPGRGDPAKKAQFDFEEGSLDYLRPNRYFKFYLFREKEGLTTCWLPEGFCV